MDFNTIIFNQLDTETQKFKHCIIETSISHLNLGLEILDSIIEYMYFNLDMKFLESYLDIEMDMTQFNNMCIFHRLNIRVSSSQFNFEFNPPSDFNPTHYEIWDYDLKLSDFGIDITKGSSGIVSKRIWEDIKDLNISEFRNHRLFRHRGIGRIRHHHIVNNLEIVGEYNQQ